MVTRGFTECPPPQERRERLPPGQYLTEDFPVLQFGPTPRIRSEDWRFTLRDDARPTKSWTCDEFGTLPRTRWQGDIHCVTKWSKFEATSDGVSIDDILADAGIAAPTAFTLAEGYDDYSTNLPFAHLTGGRAMVAILFDGQPMPTDHRGLARLLVPHLYFWKSAKWLKGLRFTQKAEADFWELRGYHIHGDPWREQRFTSD